MTKIALLGFTCTRCNKSFLSYVDGKKLWDCHDEGYCFDSEEYGIVHENSYLNTIKGKRECWKCSQHIDIMSFGLHT